MEQLISLLEQLPQTNREPASQTRKSPAPVDSPRPCANSRTSGDGGAQEEELGAQVSDPPRQLRVKSRPSGAYLRPPHDEPKRNPTRNYPSSGRRQPRDEQGSSLLRSVSDVFSSPNDGLDLSNLRASLNERRRAREELDLEESRVERRRRAELEEEKVLMRAEERRKIRNEEK